MGDPAVWPFTFEQAVFVADFLSDPNFVNFRDKPVLGGTARWMVKPDHVARRTSFGDLRHVFPRSSQPDVTVKFS